MAAKHKLKKVDIEAYLAGPNESPLHDGGGLYLRKRGANAYWYLRQRNAATGARTWAPVFPPGPSAAYPGRNLDDARKAARDAEVQADQPGGLDLIRQRAETEREALAERARRAAAGEAERLERERRITVQALFSRWREVDLQPHVGANGKRLGRKDGGQYTAEQFDRHVFPAIGARAVVDVRKADLMDILDRVKSTGRRRTANVLLADLKQMLNWALNRELIERNPLATVTRREVGGEEGGRERILGADEIKALAQALQGSGMSPRSTSAVWLILSTGCRISEAMGARWENVDFTTRTWYLPDSKNQRDHTIHLSEFALRQFAELRRLEDQRVHDAIENERIERRKAARARGMTLAEANAATIAVDTTGIPELQPSEWVFPNARNTGPVDVKSFGKQLADRQRAADRRLQGRAKATDSLALPGGRWTAHDLRRTAATVMAELGISGDVIDECLNHVIESRVRRTYIRNRRLPEQARAFDALGGQLQQLTDGAASRPAPGAPTLRRVA
ncbi:tyrosine-type recombinase/integrase [Aquincola sp. S2]|uniref:Tyrosine-type recombinase/integrase n=1 Tax=Pseudaquabacterium terrae TaxID=2732868 RepID=A0ABX2EJ68_9BURK|nr:site-specific integrase [Aquabacterium terrae]NRF68658.1 tyrosine-type recombinase/integrase [Aquabacterium terrae]